MSTAARVTAIVVLCFNWSIALLITAGAWMHPEEARVRFAIGMLIVALVATFGVRRWIRERSTASASASE